MRLAQRVSACLPGWKAPGAGSCRRRSGREPARAGGYCLAGSPSEAGAADLMEVLKDPSIHGIISTIGGDDSIRMLPFLDYSVIRDNPKVFLGYSDSTITHFAFLKAGVTSFYGPSLMAGFDENGGLPPYMAESVRQVLFTPSPSWLIPPNSGGWTCASWDWADEKRNEKKRTLQRCSGWKWLQGKGQHRGHLIGGCLEVMYWLRGTPVLNCRGSETAYCSWRHRRISHLPRRLPTCSGHWPLQEH
jgi:muramoyltetrapeptide carboxypeptidase LdcA involved in peptidoglycan recycling